MRSILKNNRSFFIPYVLFLIIGAIVLIANSKSETHLEFNKFHTSFFDLFFYYITFLGDVVTTVLIVIIMLCVKYRYAVIIAVSNIVATCFTQILKHTIFSDVVRPKLYFQGVKDLYFVPGVENYLYNSFPSGHTTCAFSLYLSLAMIVKNMRLKFLFFTVALLVGYSRIYLSQHFLEDVYGGSVVGVVTTLLIFYFIQRKQHAWMEGSIMKR